MLSPGGCFGAGWGSALESAGAGPALDLTCSGLVQCIELGQPDSGARVFFGSRA